MIWSKKTCIFFSLFSVLFSVFLSLIFSDTSYAVSDLVYTITSNQSTPILCYSTTPCSDYNYMIIELSSDVPYDFGINFQARTGANRTMYDIAYNNPRSSYFIIGLTENFSFTDSNFYSFKISSYSNFTAGTITITLTESLDSNVPTGTLSVTENGTYDVTEYAEVDVDVPPEIQEGDYHNDLIAINQSILTCGAICLVIYFFYCIYRMIIKSTGGRQ